mmetsp:Transcript_7989/g.14955  ORF Transcript_7989/g.14955 Transcript_7989/m.14955 type:complete len:226 (-) Transcript_7989:134-811(-)
MVVCSTCCMVSSVFATCSWISEDSFLIFSIVARTLLSSRIEPCTFDKAERRPSSNSLILTLNSPCSFSMSARILSTSGRSDFSSLFMHWLCNEEGVIVKLTNVTRLQRSGVNWAVESRVTRYISKLALKSISLSPKEMQVRKPFLNVSLFRTLLRMGSIRSTSITSTGSPNRIVSSRFLMKLGSTKDVTFNRRFLNSFFKYATAWPEGSITSGYLMKRLRMIAFS